MAASLGLDPRVWQLCSVKKKGEKTSSHYFHNVISKKSFYTLPPDEYDKTYSEEELKCCVPNVNGNGLKRYFPKVPEKTRLEVDVVIEEDLDVTATPTIHLDTDEDTDEEEEERKFAIDETFHVTDLRYKLKADLLEKCVEQGILHHYLEDGNGRRKGQVMVVPNNWINVDKFFP
jgi:hypothetical protein